MSVDILSEKELQNCLNDKSGFLIVVKLLNRDELLILLPDISNIIAKFNKIPKEICKSVATKEFFYSTCKTKVYIILQSKKEISEDVANKLYNRLQLYVDDEYPEAYLKSSVGIIKLTKENNSSSKKLLSLINHTFNANAAKQINYYNFDDHPLDIEQLRDNNIKLNFLRNAIINNNAKFVYQSIVSRKTGNIEYYECLLRIENNHGKYVSVGDIINDAEEKGLINVVDFMVIEMAIDELIKNKNIHLSVNISNLGLLNQYLVIHIEKLLTKHKVADRLIIEITEISLNRNYKLTKYFIDQLHIYGCKFALDDFGAGFTSFKQLQNLPIDIIKIDGCYIKDIIKNKHSKFLVRSLIAIANDMGIKTVAEYVENAQIAECLEEIKIDFMQGNYFMAASEKRIN